MERRRKLKEKIEEAKGCCGLPPAFLDEKLQELDAEVKVLRTDLGIEQRLKEKTSATQEQYESGATSASSLGQSTTSATSTSAP